MVASRASEDLTVLSSNIGGVAPDMMMDAFLKRKAFAALDRRDGDYEILKTPDQLLAYQQRLRDFFLGKLGEFPERTPLNARIVGKRSFNDYRIEKIIFESRPQFYVTATLYLPSGTGPYPGVLHPTGHSANAKARDLYQRASIVMAKNGLAVLCYDPLGQGERRHFFDDEGRPSLGTTSEHMLMGQGCTLLGACLAHYFIWDAMRGIDYLQSRSDIDGSKIGCTGISGGGTQTSYIMACDDRVVSAAPGCYLTGYRRLLQTIGPQDIEQNIHGQIAFGLDHGDYIMMRAPQPTLIMAATRDYFDIEGAWHLFRQSKRFYTRFGFAERVDLIEPDTEHGFPSEMRIGATRWMRQWLLDKSEAVFESEFPVLSDEELRCTPEGQVLRIPGARSVFDLNTDWDNRLKQDRRRFWKETPRNDALERVREIAGIRRLNDIPSMKVVKNSGTLQRDGYTVKKLVLQNEPHLWLPALAFVPDQVSAESILYLHGNGKHVDANQGGAIEQLVDKGHIVLAVDLRGCGETARKEARAFADLAGADWQDVTLAYLLGKSYVGMRTEDVLACSRFLQTYRDNVPQEVRLVAIGSAGVPALHAAAVEPELYKVVEVSQTLKSWSEVVRVPLSKNQMVNTVYGALKSYDLPDLAALGAVTVH